MANIKDNMNAHSMATVLDLAYVQYSVQWQKIGNMQTSSGSILTVLSIIISLMIGITSQIESPEYLFKSLGIFKYSFYISFLFSLIYLIISACYVYGIMKPKKANILKYPSAMRELIAQDVLQRIKDGDDEVIKAFEIDSNMMLKLNEEIEEIHKILYKNQKRYAKCLRASIFSFFSCLISLCHSITHFFCNNTFYIVVIGILGYISAIGIIVIIFDKGDLNDTQGNS